MLNDGSPSILQNVGLQHTFIIMNIIHCPYLREKDHLIRAHLNSVFNTYIL